LKEISNNEDTIMNEPEPKIISLDEIRLKIKVIAIIRNHEQMEEADLTRLKLEIIEILGHPVDEELNKMIAKLEKPISYIHDRIEDRNELELYEQGKSDEADESWKRSIRKKKLRKIKM
jgi:hypothetical protein